MGKKQGPKQEVLANWCGKKSYKSTLKVPGESLSGKELI